MSADAVDVVQVEQAHVERETSKGALAKEQPGELNPIKHAW